MQLQFIRSLKKVDQFDVLEPGVVRQQLLTLRIVAPEGIPLANADALSVLNTDLILTADVVEYEDYQGVFGNPRVDFSAQLIDRKSRSIVWSRSAIMKGMTAFSFSTGESQYRSCHGFADDPMDWRDDTGTGEKGSGGQGNGPGKIGLSGRASGEMRHYSWVLRVFLIAGLLVGMAGIAFGQQLPSLKAKRRRPP